MTTKNLYEVRQGGSTLHLTWCGDEDHEAMPAAEVELSYIGKFPPSVDGIYIDRIEVEGWDDWPVHSRPEHTSMYDAAQAFLDSPQCDYDAIAEALGLVFTNAHRRDDSR